MLNAHKNLATVKALEEKVGPTIEGLQKIVDMDLGDLTTVKEAVQASDAGSILVALRKAGRSEKADQLSEILEKVFDWADSAFTSGEDRPEGASFWYAFSPHSGVQRNSFFTKETMLKPMSGLNQIQDKPSKSLDQI